MYERFYGLRERPFNLTPDPEFLYLSRTHKEALNRILYGISQREGFTAILGDVGTGKTTLCWSLLGRLEGNVRTALILNPMLTEEELLRAILQDFDVRAGKSHPAPPGGFEQAAAYESGTGWTRSLSRKDLLDELARFLLECAENDVFCVVIIDEAQNLPIHTLEQLRMLSNLETAKKKLIQIIFVGQLEFGEKLKLAQLRALNQRISIRYRIEPLSRRETREYIYHRLRIASAPIDLTFSRAALRIIRRYSKGYPRLVNIICDRALLAGYSERSFLIKGRMVAKAARGLRGRAEFRRTRPLTAGALATAAGFLVVALLATLLLWIWRWMPPIDLQALRAPSPTQAMTRGEPPGRPAEADKPSVVEERPSGSIQDGAKQPARPPIQFEPSETLKERVQPAAPPLPEASSREVAVTPGREPLARPSGSRISEGPLVVQVHSLTTQQQLDWAIAQLRQEGYEPFYRVEDSWFVVYVGPYTDARLAEETQKDLVRRFSPTAFVRPPPQ
ncbi:MAG: AAA family ATPase [Acidobacteria bacterium]|nr:AAA family ATPase [Acidobacteriota bacterium]